MDEIKRLTPAQRARCNRLIRRLCANYDGGNCLPLDDGEGCVCVQTISYSLLCRWFRAAVLPLDAALCAEISKSRDEVKRCAVCGAVHAGPRRGPPRRQGTLRRYLPAAYTDLRTVWKALCTQ